MHSAAQTAYLGKYINVPIETLLPASHVNDKLPKMFVNCKSLAASDVGHRCVREYQVMTAFYESYYRQRPESFAVELHIVKLESEGSQP